MSQRFGIAEQPLHVAAVMSIGLLMKYVKWMAEDRFPIRCIQDKRIGNISFFRGGISAACPRAGKKWYHALNNGDNRMNMTRMLRGIAVVTLLLLAVVRVQAQEIRAVNGTKIGSIEATGAVRSENGAKVGSFEADGTVRAANNAKLGKIDADGTVRAANGSKLGKIESDGTVRAANGTKLGRVHDDGRIEGANGARLGSARNVRMVWTAAYWFFFFR